MNAFSSLQAFVVMRVEAGEPAGLPLLLAAAAPGVTEADCDFVQSLVTALLAGMRGSNSTTTKWLSVQQAVVRTCRPLLRCAGWLTRSPKATGFLSRASRLGVRGHLQALRFLEVCNCASLSSLFSHIGHV
jgi:hypothetical protein